METLMLIGQLAWTFFVIGAFTIGGGYAMLSLIQNQVVVEHPWISESAFTDIVAISQMTPGPIGINSATYVGYEVLFNATGSHLLGVCGSQVVSENFPDWKSWVLLGAAFIASYWGKVNPIYVILGGAAMGLLLY